MEKENLLPRNRVRPRPELQKRTVSQVLLHQFADARARMSRGSIRSAQLLTGRRQTGETIANELVYLFNSTACHEERLPRLRFARGKLTVWLPTRSPSGATALLHRGESGGVHRHHLAPSFVRDESGGRWFLSLPALPADSCGPRRVRRACEVRDPELQAITSLPAGVGMVHSAV